MASKCKNPWTKMHPALKAFVVIVMFVVYLAVGAAIFEAIERPAETARADAAKQLQQEIIANLTREYNLSLAALGNITSFLGNYCDAANRLTSAEQRNWVYGAAFFFSLTVVTTIGYGNISPSTQGGKIFVVWYALIGIPLTGFMLGMIGKFYGTFYRWLGRKSTCFRNHKKWFLLGFALITFVLFMLIPGLIFTAIEGWTYRDSMYYVFVTLTTIGFGDFVAGQQQAAGYREFYKVCIGFWIILGLSILALFINAMTDKVEGKITAEESTDGSKDEDEKDKSQKDVELVESK